MTSATDCGLLEVANHEGRCDDSGGTCPRHGKNTVDFPTYWEVRVTGANDEGIWVEAISESHPSFGKIMFVPDVCIDYSESQVKKFGDEGLLVCDGEIAISNGWM